MPTPQPLPLRVLVKGASTVGWASPMDNDRANLHFPRVIEGELLRSGRSALVRTISVPSERTKSTLRSWQQEMIGDSPDVVVLVYGHYETIHLVLPWWLERHANSLQGRPGRLRELYRARVLRPLWMALAKLQARLDSSLDPTLRRSRPRRVAADLERLIGHIQSLHHPLVYCFELLPPGRRYRSWFPGMAARVAVMNDAIEAMVKRVDRPDVRYFRVSSVVDEVAGGDLDTATPDGFHYSTDVHRRIGELLARDIATWADDQAHLAVPAASSAPRAPRAPRKAAAKKVAKQAVKAAAKSAAKSTAGSAVESATGSADEPAAKSTAKSTGRSTAKKTAS